MTQTPPISTEKVEALKAGLLRLTAKGDALIGWIEQQTLGEAPRDIAAWHKEKDAVFRLALTAAASIPATVTDDVVERFGASFWGVQWQRGGFEQIRTALAAALSSPSSWAAIPASRGVETTWDVQEFKVWKGINPDKPVWHSRGFACQTWADANELLEYLQHNCPELLLRVAPNPHAASPAPQPVQEQEPVAWLIDPGAGSAMDKVVRQEPMAFQYAEYIGRGGSVTPLYASPPEQELAAKESEPVQCCMCGKKGLSTIEGDGGTECQLGDGRWVCSFDCWDRAVGEKPISPALAIEAAEAKVERLTEALSKLEKAATLVQRCGAQTGSHWTVMGGALLSARAALGDTP